uniref:Uncharacterized protein n=1 Tax=Panagrolaimus sp. ES5 TaxID=591445 RepID=A0AC34FGZ4_9BILA
MNLNPHIYFKLCFGSATFSIDRTRAIEKYVQTIIDNGLTENPPPLIRFGGQTEEQYDAIRMLRDQYDEQKNREI